uniref:Uncharacterized protein n=1 Tax=Glossina brevipalpis TaxID=37001 RepID=A0A1A9WEJ7_9MUSC
MDQDTGSVYMQSSYKDIQLYGLRNFTIKKLDFNLINNKLKAVMKFPKIFMKSEYTIDGKIMMLPIVGAGPCNANFTDVEIDLNILWEIVSKENQAYFKINDIEVHYQVGNAQIHLLHLFNGDNALSESMNQYINENWDTISEDFRPLLQEALREFIKTASDKLFTVYSYNDLLPE